MIVNKILYFPSFKITKVSFIAKSMKNEMKNVKTEINKSKI